MNAPIKFQGSEEERLVNRLTHNFVSFDPEEPMECMDCCARTYHVAADYPCGVEPPREDTHIFVNGLGIIAADFADYNLAEAEDH